MMVRCECNLFADDFLLKLRRAGWMQPEEIKDCWLCPTCAQRRAVAPASQAKIRVAPSDTGTTTESLKRCSGPRRA